MIDGMTSRYVDLSHPIEHEMTSYPGLPGPAISTYLSREKSAQQLIEHLTNLDRLPEQGARLTALPALVHGLGSFPIRAVAMLR